MDSGVALEQARLFYRQAIEAEGRQDFAAAVNLYRLIQKLPSDAWQTDLQFRLENARKRSLQSSSTQ